MLLGAVVTSNSGKAKVYISATLATLSIVLSLFVLTEIFLLLSYFVFTFLLTTVIVTLKIRFLLARKSQSLKNVQEIKDNQKWKIILLSLFFIIALIAPVLSLAVLPPVSWFIGLNGFVSAVSLSEVVIFYYARRSFRNKKVDQNAFTPISIACCG